MRDVFSGAELLRLRDAVAKQRAGQLRDGVFQSHPTRMYLAEQKRHIRGDTSDSRLERRYGVLMGALERICESGAGVGEDWREGVPLLGLDFRVLPLGTRGFWWIR